MPQTAVPAADILAGESWTCAVTPSDGTDDGTVAIAQVTVAREPTTVSLSTSDYALIGEGAADYAGFSLSSAGDVDGGGLGDILIGAIGNDDGGTLAGKACLFLGSTLAASSASAIDLCAAGHAFIGESGDDEAGISVSGAGDVDDDGRSDLAVGAYGNGDGGSGG